MSFNIFVSRFRDEEIYKFPAAELRERFGSAIVGQRRNSWHLGFEQGESFAEIQVPSEEFIPGFNVRRPPDFLEFWTIIAGFLTDLDCVLFWPGGGAVVARLDVLPHLPKEMIERLGIPWVTTDASKIRDYVGDHS
jgi:hypothetical protein